MTTTVDRDDQAAALAVLLAEYAALKAEQQERIKGRDGLTYATLTAVAAAGYAAVQTHTLALLLAIAPACAVLGWTRLATDARVSDIGRYLAAYTRPALAACGVGGAALAWEVTVRGGPRRVRKTAQLVVDLLTFVAPAAAGPAVWLAAAPQRPGVLAAGAVAGLVLAVGLAGQIIGRADLGTDTRVPRSVVPFDGS